MNEISLVEKIIEVWNNPDVFARADTREYTEGWMKSARIEWDEFYPDHPHPSRTAVQREAIKSTISLIYDSNVDIEDEAHPQYVRQYAQLIREVQKMNPAIALIDISGQVRICAEVLIQKGVI